MSAINEIGAWEYYGNCGDYIYFAEETGKLYTFTKEEAEEAEKIKAATIDDWYTHWCAAGCGKELSYEDTKSLQQEAARAGDQATVELCRRHLWKEDR